MNIIESTDEDELRPYNVEILALFDIQLVHHFSDVDIKKSGGLISDTFENLIYEIEDIFSSLSVNINFESAKRKRKDDTYKLNGSIQRCYGFAEKDIYECELIEGAGESQLDDMKLVVEEACDMSGYELNITHFSWADDEVIDEE